MKKKKALLILTPGFPENEADDTFIPPQQLFVKALAEISEEIQIIVISLYYPCFSGSYDWHGIQINAFGRKNSGKIFRLFTGWRVWRTLLALHRKYELIGLLSFWLGKSAQLAQRFSTSYGIPHRCWLLGQDAKKGNKYYNQIKPKAEQLIALSDFIREEFYRNYKVRPQHVVPVGIDPALFPPEASERDIDLLGAGSLIPLKQFELFLEVVRDLLPLYPQLKVRICGDGPLKEELQEVIQQYGLKARVQLLGKQDYRKVLWLMQRSKIFLHTSAYEGFGAVCLEALYAGAQVISFVQPMEENIPHWHSVKDREAMLLKICEILEDPARSHERVLKYSIQENAAAVLRLFTS